MTYYYRRYNIMELEVLHLIGSGHTYGIDNNMLDLVSVIQAPWM